MTISSIGTGQTYTTIQAWEDAAPADIVASGSDWIGELNTTGGGNEWLLTATLTFSGATTSDATHRKILRCASGLSFAENAGKITNALRYNASNGIGIRTTTGYLSRLIIVQDAFTEIHDIQIYMDVSGNAASPVVQTPVANLAYLNGCLVQNRGNTYLVGHSGSTNDQTVYSNCLFIQAANNRISYRDSTGSAIEFHNCTFVSVGSISTTSAAVHSQYSGVTNKLLNCSVFGFQNITSGAVGLAAASNYNATDLTAPTNWGANSLASLTYANQFEVTSGSDTTYDFRTKAGADLISAGTRDQTYTTDLDILNQARSTTAPTIGAMEVVTAAAVGPALPGPVIFVGGTYSSSGMALGVDTKALFSPNKGVRVALDNSAGMSDAQSLLIASAEPLGSIYGDSAAVATATGSLTSAAAALAGAAQAIVTATGDLPTSAAALAGALQSVATAAGALTTQIQLAGAATDQATATGALTTQVQLAGGASTAATAAAALSTQIQLAAAATAQAAATGSLTTQIQFAGSATGQATATAALTTGVFLFGAAQAIATAVGAITTQVQLAGDAAAIATATGALSTGSGLAGSATGSATASATLTTLVKLAGDAAAAATAVGALTTAVLFAGVAQDVATATGSLTQGVTLAGNAAAAATATGSLTAGVRFSGAMASISTATADLLTSIRFAGDAIAQSQASGDLTTGAGTMAGIITAISTATAQLSTSVQFAGAMQAASIAQGALGEPEPEPSSAQGSGLHARVQAYWDAFERKEAERAEEEARDQIAAQNHFILHVATSSLLEGVFA